MTTSASFFRVLRERVPTDADRAAITLARLLQRRLRAATRRKDLTASRTRRLGERLHRQRAAGFGRELCSWLADYRETIDADCRWSAR